MTREEAFNLLKNKINDPNMIKHSLAVEACLRELARYFNQNEDQWRLAGLLHDYDYKEMINNPERHGLAAAEELEKLGLTDPVILQAIRAHNEQNHTPRESFLDKAIHAVDPLTGLIVAATLVLPSKKLQDLTVENILKRYREKRFAAGANREIIARCVDLNLNLEQFISICLQAMQKISDTLGL